MATWTIQRTNPRIEGNLFKVDYSILKDGVVVFTDTAETSQPQDSTWPQSIAKQKLIELRDTPDLVNTITPGDITPPSDPAPDAGKAAWLLDYGRFQAVKPLVDAGVIPASNPKYVALLNRLKNNLQITYLDLG